MRNKGFTLVELSIVLVIIGLLLSGVMAGKTLIDQSKLQKILSDIKEINVATNQFMLKYGYYPGDIPDASSLFNCSADQGNNVCDGNGDGLIGYCGTGFSHGSSDCSSSCGGINMAGREGIRAVEHLHLAKFIDYSELTNIGQGYGGTRCKAWVGSNTPESALGDDSGYLFGDVWGNGAALNITVGKNTSAGSGKLGPWDPIFTPAQAFSLDKKIDNGLPNTGHVQVAKWDGSVPYDCHAEALTAYDLNNTDVDCALRFELY